MASQSGTFSVKPGKQSRNVEDIFLSFILKISTLKGGSSAIALTVKIKWMTLSQEKNQRNVNMPEKIQLRLQPAYHIYKIKKKRCDVTLSSVSLFSHILNHTAGMEEWNRHSAVDL